jgi:hypothetical protein
MTCLCGQLLLAPQSRQRGICERCWIAAGNPASHPAFTGGPGCWRSQLPAPAPADAAVHLDWDHPDRWNRGRHEPCHLCGRPAFLLDDAGRAAHKRCVEGAVENRRHLKAIPTTPTQERTSA